MLLSHALVHAGYLFYGQGGEDAYVFNRFFSLDGAEPIQRNGTYVELGALDGRTFSNTKFFEDTLGWGGLLIEPSPRNFARLNVSRRRPQNTLVNSAVCGQSGTIEWSDAGGSGRTQAMSGIVSDMPNAVRRDV